VPARSTIRISMNNKLKKLQENLADDLVHLEENESLSEKELEEITDAYSKVYNVINEIKSL